MLIKYIGSCMTIRQDVWDKVGAMSHPEKRCGICRYSDRVVRAKYDVARTYPPKSESIDMPQHKDSLRFSKFNEYTKEIAPVSMQNVDFYNAGIEECRKFDASHRIDENGFVILK